MAGWVGTGEVRHARCVAAVTQNNRFSEQGPVFITTHALLHASPFFFTSYVYPRVPTRISGRSQTSSRAEALQP